jgi:hypothetical protein
MAINRIRAHTNKSSFSMVLVYLRQSVAFELAHLALLLRERSFSHVNFIVVFDLRLINSIG